ncbi:MAG: PIN domain-containing protein [Streptosporangiaceae bacterium]
MLRSVLNPQVPLFREARYLLAEDADIRDTALYHAVLGAIAAGNSTRGGIASFIGRKSPDIGHPLTVLEDAQLIARERDPFRQGRSLYRVCEPLIVFYEAVMRPQWTRLERGDRAVAWRNSQATFLAQVAGPHFAAICRDWAMSSGADAFGDWPSEVAAAIVADPARRTQIEVDVAVLAVSEPGRPRRILSPGEAKWDKIMTVRHLDRLRRARDLLHGYHSCARCLRWRRHDAQGARCPGRAVAAGVCPPAHRERCCDTDIGGGGRAGPRHRRQVRGHRRRCAGHDRECPPEPVMIVVDTSAMVEFLVGADLVAERIRDLVAGEKIAVPHAVDLECASTLRGLVHGKKLPVGEAERALQLLARMSLKRYGHAPLLPRIWQLRHSMWPYDAAYVALAESLNAELVTLDARIAKAPGLRCAVRNPS